MRVSRRHLVKSLGLVACESMLALSEMTLLEIEMTLLEIEMTLLEIKNPSWLSLD
jgi:hypothetical protein